MNQGLDDSLKALLRITIGVLLLILATWFACGCVPTGPSILDCGGLRPVFSQRWDGSLYIVACI